MERDELLDIGDGVSQTACGQCGNVVDVSDTPPFSVATCPHCQTRLAVPAKLGDFLLLKVLGKGTMGAAYKAYDRVLGRHVAIKVMRKSLGDDKQIVDRFLGEARALAALHHRNVVMIYSLGKDKGRPYIVMELAPGGTLRDQMRRGQGLAEDEVLGIGMAVAEGLQAAHGIGLIHGDVKPANILFGEDGTPKLVDFGLARFGGVRGEPGEGLGTPYYVAPERVRQQDADHRSDIFSLGATLYHALAGRPPFDGKTIRDTLLARLKEPTPDLRAARPDVRPETAAAISRMLQVKPADRPSGYDEVLAELRAAQATPAQPPAGAGDLAHLQHSLSQPAPAAEGGSRPVSAGARPAAGPSQRGPRHGAAPRSRANSPIILLLIGVAGALLLAGAIGGIWWMVSRSKSAPGSTPTGQGDPTRSRAPLIIGGPGNGASHRPGPVDPSTPATPQPAGAGTIRLQANNAEIQGVGAHYEDRQSIQAVVGWRSGNVAVGWTFETDERGPYFVDIEYAAGRASGGEFAVEVDEKVLKGTATSAGNAPNKFRTVRVGRVRLPTVRVHTLVITGKPGKGKQSLMRLRSVSLVPVR